MLGNGDGTFQSASMLGSGTIYGVVRADFNGDRRADVAFIEEESSDVTVRLGNGDGTFGTAAQYTGSYNALGLAVADLNRDGKVDLVVAGSELSVLFAVGKRQWNFCGACTVSCGNERKRGRGRGFQWRWEVGCGGSIALTRRSGKQRHDVVMLLGDGSGTLTPIGGYSAGNGASGIIAADFNEDGKLDVAVSLAGPAVEGGALVLEGNGAGGFHEPVAGDAIGSGVVAIGDFNGDGSPDVAMATGMGSVAVFLGTRKGLFQPAINFPVEIGSSPPGGIKTADVNGDGKQDLVVALQDAIAILLGNGDGTFQPATYIAYVNIGPTGLVIGDFNGVENPMSASPGTSLI